MKQIIISLLLATPLYAQNVIEINELDNAERAIKNPVYECACRTNGVEDQITFPATPAALKDQSCRQYEGKFVQSTNTRRPGEVNQLSAVLMCDARVTRQGYTPVNPVDQRLEKLQGDIERLNNREPTIVYRSAGSASGLPLQSPQPLKRDKIEEGWTPSGGR